MRVLTVVGVVLFAAACGSEPPTTPITPDLPRSDTVEARALWVSRFEYSTASDIVQIMTDAKSANFNIVYFQVRANADALYESDLEPCSPRLCSRLGGTPAWDPLARAASEAQARGIQLHAWINSFPGWTATTATTCAALVESDAGNPRHILLEHPDWRIADNTGTPQPCPHAEGNVWLSPGIPGVRTRLAGVAADITRRYPDVAGIHLDFIRYPGPQWSHDPPSLAAFGKSPATNAAEWAQFRRDQVSAAVRETHDSVQAARPAAVLSAAVWGIYQDKWSWNSSRGYDDYFQDPRAWTTAGTLDVAVPMVYWRVQSAYCAYTDWLCLLDDHQAGFTPGGRQMYVGMYAPLGADEMVNEINLGRNRGVKGFTVFSYGSARSTGLFPRLASGVFRLPARVPDMPWK
jgi:uncharacterized lipoprotein YddW (UPF0748 family)